MFRKGIAMVMVVLVLWSSTVPNALARTELSALQNDDLRLLLVYSNAHSEVSVAIRELDLLLHHFTEHVEIVPDYELTAKEIKAATHIVYYGEVKKTLDPKLVSLFKTTSKPKLVFGENVVQISSFEAVSGTEQVTINGVGYDRTGEEMTYLQHPIVIKPLQVTEAMDVLLYGFKGVEPIPLVVQSGVDYAFTTHMISADVIYYYLADVLHELVPNDHLHQHVAYLRLEDIHPATDPVKLKEVADYLNEQDIPYILVVIPVYMDPNTGKRVYFSDSPKLLSLLQELQDTGGSVIVEDYTHSYRDKEIDEELDFWDADNDPLTEKREPDEEIEEIASQDAFPNREAYESYLTTLENSERAYIEKRLTSAIHELTSYNLMPVSFGVPYNTMSQQGYGITSEFFTSMFGQVQLTKQRGERMGAPPFISSAQFLHGMALYPETIGYVDGTRMGAMENQKRLEKVMLVRDGMIGGFYHPYLGVEYLPDFLSLYDKVPNLKWLDLKKVPNEVHTSKVDIRVSKMNGIQMNNEVSWWDNTMRQQQLSLMEKVLWGLTAFVFIFIILFFIFTIYLRTQLKKRLFRERKTIG